MDGEVNPEAGAGGFVDGSVEDVSGIVEAKN